MTDRDKMPDEIAGLADRSRAMSEFEFAVRSPTRWRSPSPTRRRSRSAPASHKAPLRVMRSPTS
jgi:hypothetical protein